MAMVDGNPLVSSIVVDRSPAPPRPEKTTTSQEEINEENHQIHRIYHFQNCGTVYMDSLNARGVRMENCGNNVPQVTYRCPKIIGSEKSDKVIHSQFRVVSNASTGPPPNPFIPTLTPTGNPYISTSVSAAVQQIAPTEIAMSSPSNVHLQTNALSTAHSLQPSHVSRDYTHHNIKYLEQLLDSALATVAVIQISGNTLADVLTPRAYDTFKALYALAALDVSASSTKPRVSEIVLTRSPLSDIGNDCPDSSNPHYSPSLSNSRLAVPRTGMIHISIPMDYVMLFSWAGLAAVSCLVVIFSLG